MKEKELTPEEFYKMFIRSLLYAALLGLFSAILLAVYLALRGMS